MPHSILMMHHPSGSSRGQASEMHIESRELVRVRDYLSLIVSDSTGQPYDRVSKSRRLRLCLWGIGVSVISLRAGGHAKIASTSSGSVCVGLNYCCCCCCCCWCPAAARYLDGARSSVSCLATNGWIPRRPSSMA
jgi:hypothetical protein